MAYTDTRQAFQDLKASTLEGLKSNFPIEGKKNVIELAGLEVRDQHLDPDDIEAQYNAKVEGRSWGAPVFGSLVMKDKLTGQIIDQKVVKLADIPHMTKRHAYIVGGNEYQVDSQWRLKPGVYVRRKENGELESKFQVTNGGFAVLYDKDKKVFKMSRGKSGSIPVYPLLKELGVDDDTLAKSWGKDVLTANQEARAGAGALEAFFRADKKRAPKDKDEARQYFHETMRNSTLRPEATEISMGKAFSSVNGELVTRATKKMLNVMNGVEQADERDALMFKDLYTVADFTKERLQSSNVKRAIQKRVARKIDTADGIRQVVKGGMFSDPVRQTFTDNALARGADQVNPVEMLASSFQTSIMGAGGIQSEQSITDEAKLINPSHLGFLDPIRTPEGCFDGATEVFTSKGWVFWSGVTESTEFACLIDGRLEFHRAEAIQAYEYTGKMYGLRKQFEYLVTPNHRMLCRPTDPGLKYRVVRADEMHGKVRAFMSAHRPLLGESKARIKLPHVDGNNSSKNIGSVDIGDWAEFIGWYLSEGNCNYNESKSYYHIKLFQSEINGDCCRRIEQLLDRLGFKWSQVERDNGRNAYSIATKQLAWIVSQLGCTAPKKHLTEDMFSWPLHARQRLIDGLLLGDGRLSHTHKSARQRGYVYTTTSKQLAEDVERMFISLGWAASLKVYKDKREERYLDVYETRLLLHREVTSQPVSVAGKRSSPFYTVDYTGMVYCATVPGSFLYTRRNKKHPLWLGNSKTGITLRLPMGATKRGNQPVIPVYSLKTGKLENIDPTTFHQSRVVLPDQVKWVNGRPVPLSDKVAVSQKGNSLVDSKFSEAEYIMRSPSQMFSMTSNLIPFLGNNSGNRATYGAAQMEQAISLAGREKPLVQVGTGSPGIKTFEDFVGRNSAHVSAVDGTITEVSPGSISIKQANGEVRKVHTYNNFPLNDQKAVLHSEPTVVVGQQVKKGDLLADNNFTRDGSLALGTNLTVGYIPFKGLNFEDGVVISESAAKKMASIHMHKPVVELAPEYITDPGKYRVLHPTSFTKDQFAKVGDNGVVRVGQKVSPGDPLVLATKPYESRGSLSLGKLRKSLSTQHMDASLVWKSDHQGEVVGVHRDGKGNVTVHVRTVEPMQIGDKMTGRAGNKGVVSTVLPDSEMPQLKNGAQVNVSLSRAAGMELQSNLVVGGTTYKAGTKLDPTVLADIRKKDPNAVAHVKQHLEAVLNPSGVPGRMNMGQVLETAASKLAQKTGKTYVVENFISHKDAITQIQKELKNNGIDDQDEVVDPVTGQNLGKALAGPQHMFKLNFQIDKKVSVRSGMPLEGAESEGYDPTTLIPSSGGKTGGQSMGNLGMYSLLAHGAKHNIREMQTWKSEGPDPSERWNSLHNEVWRAIQTGEEPPPPKKTFAFQKFEDMMRASGINVERKGHSFQLLPLTDAQVLTMSSGKLEDERASVGWGKDKNGEPIPKKGGIFDPKLTGGHGGKRWSHMELPEPMPNPVFEGAIQRVLGITRKQYTAVVYGESSLHNGKIVPYDTSLKGAKTGGAAIAEMLSKIDVKKDLASTTKELNSMKLPSDLVHRTSTTALDDLSKKVRMLQALDHAGITPQDAYTIKNLPVIPPVMRPVSFLPSGDIHEADLNKLYTDFGGIVRNMKDPTYIKDVPDSEKRADRANLYDGLKALVGTGPNWEDRGKNPKGLLLQMSGKQPKTGYFQETLLSRRQDMSMRGTITPEPHMSIDEVGLPTHKGLDLFRPFVVKKLQDLGAASSPREAQKLLAAERKKKEPSRIVTRALDLVMGERPVLLKRDPSLHKHSVQAFRARRAPGKAIQIHPLVTGGFGADFDGDSAIGGIIVLDSRCSVTSEQGSQDRDNSGMAHYGSVATFKNIDLADFPRVEETRTETNSGVIEYSVPPDIYVPGYLNGSIKMYEVTGYSVHPTCAEWVVTTRAGREIRCSSDHSLALFNPASMGVERTVPSKAEGLCLPVMRDISGGIWGSIPGAAASQHQRAHTMVDQVELTADTGWFLGATIGDGWVTTGHADNNQVCFSYGENELDIAEQWEKLGLRLSSAESTTRTTMPHTFEGRECTSSRSVISSTVLGGWLLPLIGKGAANKHLPERYLETPVAFRRGLLCGLIDTDGTACWSKGTSTKRPQFALSFTTISEQLAGEILVLGLSLGLGGSSTAYENRDKTVWIVTFSTPDVVSSLSWLKLVVPRKQEALDRLAASDVGSSRTDIVPVTPAVKKALIAQLSALGATKKVGKNTTAFTQYTLVKSATTYMLRDSATKILESLPSIPPDLQAWSAIVYDASVGWDVVESAVATGKRITMYDLTVPGALTFTMANGAVVWDTMAVYVPIGREAVKEAYDMLPSKNLYNEATGKVMYTPSLEASLGLFKLSRVTGNTQQKFATHAELLKAAQAGKISMTDTAMVAGKQTTAGRVMIASAVPDAMAPNVLNNLDFRLNKKGVTDLYTKVAKDHRVDFGDVAGKLMNLGYDASYGSLKIPNPATKGTAAAVQQDGENPARHVQFIPMGTHSFGLSDFLPDKAVRDPIVRATQRKVDALELRKGMSKQDKERASINLWFDATEKMVKDHDIKANVNPTNLHLMREAGVKPSPEQYRQLTLAPMLLTDSTNRVLPKPVTKSYAEGLDLGSYWNQMSGARRGSVLKVQEVQDPGYFTKLLMNASIGSQVSTLDCGTNHGVAMDVGDQGVYDRELIQDLTVKGHTFKSGTTLTPDVVQTIKAADKNARVLVRSPLKCEHGKGLCQKCAGMAPDGDYYKMGTNIGVLSTQALGERSTQLTLKAFHSGGVAGRDASMVNDFKRVLELTHLPQKIPDSATIAMKGGTITKIDADPTGVVVWIDGVRHHIPKDRFGNPLWKSLAGSTKPGWVPPKVGMRVQPGQVLSDPARSNVNVRDLYKATGSMVQVQNHLVNELHGIYGKEGVRRQHVELVVRNLSDLTRVIDPGDDGRSVKGGFTSTNALQSRNKELVKRGLKPAMHTPILKGIDVLPLEAQEDWMAKMNHNHIRTTVADAATYGHASNIHSSNPVSGMAYGAEFGMTEKDKFKKPQLAGVPEWSY